MGNDKLRTFLDKNNLETWDIVEITLKDSTSLKGIILPPIDLKDSIYVKLMNGYNLAIKIDRINTIKKIGKIEPKYTLPKMKKEPLEGLPEIVLIHAGGTIASRVEYTTGAISPAFSPEELSNSIPELFDLARWRLEELFNIFSENITPRHWLRLAHEIYKQLLSGVKGIIITHGTDTMHFTATAMAFMIDHLSKPVVFTGAMRSSDRPASDAAINLIASTIYTLDSDIGEVAIVMHSTPNDTEVAAYRAVRTIKIHSTRRDAFRSIAIPPLAQIDLSKRKIYKLISEHLPLGDNPLLSAYFEEKTALLYIYPGFPKELIDFLVDRNYRGLVLVGTGMGHTPKYIFDSIQRAIDSGVVVVMTTQCLSGGVYLSVYKTGRELKKMGVVSGHTMLPHAAYVKLGWLLGRNLEPREVRELFTRNLKFEFAHRENLEFC